MRPNLPPTRIFIVGHSASGKSTFGRLLARSLGMIFIDLDGYTRHRFGTSIDQIFARAGESGFRKVERAMLREVGERERVVVACGGGTPCFFDNMEYMSTRGVTVWLRASEEVITARLENSRSVRPLYKGLSGRELHEKIHRTLAERTPFYSQAKLYFDNDNDSTEMVAMEAARIITRRRPTNIR